LATFTKYTNVVAVTLNAGQTLSFAHGLRTEEGVGLIPNLILPDRSSPLVVTGADETEFTVNNPSSAAATANFLCQLDFSTQRDPDAPDTLYYQGGGGGGGGVTVTEAYYNAAPSSGQAVPNNGANPIAIPNVGQSIVAPADGNYLIRWVADVQENVGFGGAIGYFAIFVNGVQVTHLQVISGDLIGFGIAWDLVASMQRYITGITAGQVIEVRGSSGTAALVVITQASLIIEKVG
jgi:hypothetical protein